ncbi:MAG: PIN domain-containing protein [Syntrophobacteraceae bacterium]|nr:PIN domain-containing protein [Syntrophobacteraceae bacterium]
MTYLDSHVVAWMYAYGAEKLSERALKLIEDCPCVLISPMVLLELEFLRQIGKIAVSPQTIYEYLAERIALEVCGKDFREVVRNAMHQSWTRDPFDRIITAHAAMKNDILITKDGHILDHYPHATW